VIDAQGADSASPKRQPASEKFRYFLEYDSSDWRAEMLVNCLPTMADCGTGVRGVTPFIRDGKNTLRDKATQVRAEASGLVVSIVKARIQAKGHPTGREIVVKWVCTPGDKGITKEVTKRFSVKVSVKWAWEQRARIDKVTQEDKKKIYGFFRKLHDALAKKNSREACSILREVRGVLSSDFERASGTTVDAAMKRQEGFLNKLFSGKGYFVSLAQESDLVFQEYDYAVRVYAKKSDVIRADLPEAERTKVTGNLFFCFVDATFVKVNGKWLLFGR